MNIDLELLPPMSEIEVTYDPDMNMWLATRDGQSVYADSPQEAAKLVQKQTLSINDVDWIDPSAF